MKLCKMKRGKSIRSVFKDSNSLVSRWHVRGKLRRKPKPADHYSCYHKVISRMSSDKADISPAVILGMLYYFNDIGIVMVFDFIYNLFSWVIPKHSSTVYIRV